MSPARRLILCGAVCASMLASGCASTGKNAARNSEPLKLACRLANYGPHEDVGLAHIHSLGLRYVFINVPAPDQVEAVQQRLEKHQLTPLVMRGSTDLSKDSCIEELAAQAATCRRMGVEYMFLSAKRNGAETQVVCDRLRRAGDAVRKHGVTIVLETHPDLGTNGDVHVQTMRAINHPNVRVNYDTANVTYYNRDTNAVAELKKCVDYVATVEIKDHNGQFETWNFPPLGQGVVDIPGVLELLREHGYDGPITMEIEGVKGVERSEEQIRQDIAESTSYLRSVGRFE